MRCAALRICARCSPTGPQVTHLSIRSRRTGVARLSIPVSACDISITFHHWMMPSASQTELQIISSVLYVAAGLSLHCTPDAKWPALRPPVHTGDRHTQTVQGRAQRCTRTASKCKTLPLQRHRARPLADTHASYLSSGVCDWTNPTKKLCVTSQSKRSSVRVVFRISNTFHFMCSFHHQ